MKKLNDAFTKAFTSAWQHIISFAAEQKKKALIETPQYDRNSSLLR